MRLLALSLVEELETWAFADFEVDEGTEGSAIGAPATYGDPLNILPTVSHCESGAEVKNSALTGTD